MNDLKINASHIVVLGGTGFVGRHLLTALNQFKGVKVTYVYHRNLPNWLKNNSVHKERIKLDRVSSIAKILTKETALINLLRPDGTGWFKEALRKILEACRKAQVKQYIHLSSIDVYGASAENTIDLHTPLKPRTPYECEHAAGEALVSAEFPVLNAIILRLGAVFGIGGANVLALAKEVKSGPFWKLALRRALYGKRRMHLVSVEKVVEALLFFLCKGPLLQQRIFLITDDEVPENNFADLQDTLIRVFNRTSLSSCPCVPSFILKLLLRLKGLSNLNSKRRFKEDFFQASAYSFNSHFSIYLYHYLHYLKEHENSPC